MKKQLLFEKNVLLKNKKIWPLFRLNIFRMEILEKKRNEGLFMCTAISYKAANHYFGRNLDLEYSYEETITITPRKYPLKFRKVSTLTNHFAMIGVAYVKEDYPLYFDAVNEKGLGMAGLNFPGNAVYLSEINEKKNIAPFELIPWVLAQCESVEQAKELLLRTNAVKLSYCRELPLTPLHFLVSDEQRSFVVEPREEGLVLIENPVGVLTNNPPFQMQMSQLNLYMHLTNKEPINTFSKALPLEVYSRGMGGIGLPGDFSSPSRFVRAAFVKENSVSGVTEEEQVSQFFHILNAVEQPKGCVKVGQRGYECTIYSSCCNTKEGIYYYRTYGNSQITSVDMHRVCLEQEVLYSYPLIRKQNVFQQN